MREYYVYILAIQKNGTLYIGVTNDLIRRVFEHKRGGVEGFTKKYNVETLVHYEQYNDVWLAIQREKNLKKWKREWKIKLVEENNPNWDGLYRGLVD